MLTVSGIQTVIANSFFDGSLEIAGLIMYAVALALVMALTYKGIGAMGSILLGLPVTIVFNALGVVSGDLLIVMIIVTVLSIGVVASRVGFGGK